MAPPTANSDIFSVAEDSTDTVLDVLFNDTTAPDTGETLTVESVTQPSNGTVTLVGGVVRFTTAAEFNGTTSFTYTVNDGNSGTDTATVTITVTPENDAPDAQNDAFTVPENSGATVLDVLANDSTVPDTGETLTVESVTQPSNGTVTLGGGGVSFTPAPNFNGTTAFTYTISDGNGGTDIATVTMTVSAATPAPVVSSPPDGSITNDPTPTISGTATPTDTVTIFINAASIGTTTAIGDGTWNFTVPVALSDGVYQVKATAMDTSSNTSPDSNTNTFTVDTTPPAAPVVITPANGTVQSDNTPTYSGTAEPGSTITVFVDGTPVGTTTADGAATWIFTQPTALADGTYTVHTTSTDATGNTSPNSNTNTFTVDTTPPAAPVVLTPANGSTTNDNTPTYSGTAEPGSTISIIVNGTPVGTTTANGAGNWSFTPTVALADGPHSVRATASAPGGGTSPDSNTNTFTVDTTPPAAPVVLTPPNGSTTNDNTPTYSGTAEPGSTVTLFVDGASVGTTTADGAATWIFTQPSALANGSHSVKATATDAVGNTSADSNTNTFTLNTTLPTAVVVLTPADGSSTSDTTPVITGTAPPGSTVIIYIDGVPAGAAQFSPPGSSNWTFSMLPPLSYGTHQVKVLAADAGGNPSPDSNVNTFSILRIPDTTVVSGPRALTNQTEATFEFSSGSPGVTYECKLDEADFTPCSNRALFTALGEGVHRLMARAKNAAGAADDTPAIYSWTVDLTPPEVILTSSPPGVSTERSATFEFSSNETPVVFECSLNGKSFITCQSPMTFDHLPEGAHQLRVRAKDAADNRSLEPAVHEWTIEWVTAGGCGCSAEPGASGHLAFVLLVLMSLVTRAAARR
jgi:hypothetical protein